MAVFTAKADAGIELQPAFPYGTTMPSPTSICSQLTQASADTLGPEELEPA